MAEKQDRKRRITGEAYWRLRGLQKQLEEGQKQLQKWREEKLEELKVYPDQVNWNTGAIYDPIIEIKKDETTGEGRVVNAKVIDRVPLEMLADHRAKGAELEEIAAKLVEHREHLAKRLRTWPDAISLKDGTVDGEAYVAVDPEADLTPQDEKAADFVERTLEDLDRCAEKLRQGPVAVDL
jgi:hypothetical protein